MIVIQVGVSLNYPNEAQRFLWFTQSLVKVGIYSITSLHSHPYAALLIDLIQPMSH